jgi:hypothetical protein
MMADFNEAKFRSDAKAAGYSDEEINAELGTPAGSAPPLGMAANPAIEQQFNQEFAQGKATLRKDYEDQTRKIETESPFTIPGFLTSPTVAVTGAALLGALGTYAAPKVYRSVKERYMTKAPEIDRTIDIPMDFNPSAPVTVQPTNQPPVANSAPNLNQRAAEIIEDNLKRGLGGQQMAPVAPVEAAPMGPVAPTAPMAPEAPQPIATPLSAAPVDAPAPTPTAGPNSAVTSTVVDEVKSLLAEANQPVAPPQQLMTGTGKPAFAGMGPEAKISKRTGKPQFKSEYASLADVPKGYAVVPNAQYVDVLRGIGQPEFTQAFTGKNFPTDYEQAVEATKEINRQLGRPTRAEAKAAGQPYGENVPGITQRTTENKKLVNVKGVGLGALVAIPDLVKAQTASERGMAGANLLEAVLPPGFAMSGAGEGSGAVPGANAAMLLGSPYAQSAEAKKLRQDQEYIRKIGGGRGIAPPSAYMR